MQTGLMLENSQKISFKSKKITRTGPRKATITGDLTMLGVTKEIKLKAKFNKAYKVKPYVGKAALGFLHLQKLKEANGVLTLLFHQLAMR